MSKAVLHCILFSRVFQSPVAYKAYDVVAGQVLVLLAVMGYLLSLNVKTVWVPTQPESWLGRCLSF